MESRDGSGTIHLPDRIFAVRQYGEGILARSSGPLREQGERADADIPAYRHLIDNPESGPGESHTHVIDTPVGSVAFTVMEREEVDEYRISGHHVAFFDMEVLDFPLVLRPVQQGDRIRPLGMQGSKTVARLLQDAKMPPDERRRVPALAIGEDIVWVIGVRVGSHAAITADTRKVLKAEFILPIADS
jgi:tRNA(Ile)-lysidine synthase